MILLHGFPVESTTKYIEYIEEEISYEHNKVEILGSKCPVVCLFINIVAHLKLITILAINVDEYE